MGMSAIVTVGFEGTKLMDDVTKDQDWPPEAGTIDSDLAYWRRRIAEAESIAALEQLYAEAKALPSDIQRQVYLRIGQAKIVMNKSARILDPPAFAASLDLPHPDGRPLHRYRLDDAGFERLEASLKVRQLDDLNRGYTPALFVLWASEWFRRKYGGGGYSWAELVAALQLQVKSHNDQAVLRNAAERGLTMWRREVLRFEGGRSFLGSLAREGGFPSAAFADGRGWSRDVLGPLERLGKNY